MSPQARHRYWSVIACVPKREITSASVSPQCGQRGAERGRSGVSGSCGIEPSLLEAAQHAERALVDGAGAAAAPRRVPARPVDVEPGGAPLQALLQAGPQLVRAPGEGPV